METVRTSVKIPRWNVLDTKYNSYTGLYADSDMDQSEKIKLQTNYKNVKALAKRLNDMDNSKSRFIAVITGWYQFTGAIENLQRYVNYNPILSNGKLPKSSGIIEYYAEHYGYRIPFNDEKLLDAFVKENTNWTKVKVRISRAKQLEQRSIKEHWGERNYNSADPKLSSDETIRHWQSANWNKTNNFKPITTPSKQKKDNGFIADKLAIAHMPTELNDGQLLERIRTLIQDAYYNPYRDTTITQSVYWAIKPLIRPIKVKGRIVKYSKRQLNWLIKKELNKFMQTV